MTIEQVVSLARMTIIRDTKPEPPVWWIESHGFTLEQYREAASR